MDSNHDGDKRVAKGKKTRQDILAAAFTLLTKEGPKALSAGRIARAAGISKANLFHHFRKMDEIPFALLEDLFNQFSGMMSGKKPKSISEYINVIGSGVLNAPPEVSRTAAAFVHFYIRAAHEESFRALQEKTTLSFIQHLEGGFEEILSRRLTAAERRIAPTLVAACLEGIGLFAITFQDRESLRAAWKAMAQWVGDFLEKEK